MQKIKYDIVNLFQKDKIILFTPDYENLYTPKSNHEEVTFLYKNKKWEVININSTGNNKIPLHGVVLSFPKNKLTFELKQLVEIENYQYYPYFNSLINQENKRCIIHKYNQRNYENEIVLLDRKWTIFTLPTQDYYEMVLKLDNIARGFIVNTNNFKEYRNPFGREIDKGSYVLLSNKGNDKFYRLFKINDQVSFEFPMVQEGYELTINYTDYNPTENIKKIGDVSVLAFREADTCMIYDIDGVTVDKKTRRTGTNPWGHEIAVDATGLIVESATNVKIPENGFVISGVSEYYSILKDKFLVGGKVKLDKKNKTVTLYYNHLDACLYNYHQNLSKIQKVVRKLENDYYDLDHDLIYKYYKKYLPLEEKLVNRRSMYIYSQDEKERLYHLYRFDGYYNKSFDYYNQLFKLSMESSNMETRACWHEPHEKTLQEVIEHLEILKNSNFNELIVGGIMPGGTIYPSKYMKINDFVDGFYGEEYKNDYLKCLLTEAKKRNIKVQLSSDNFFIAKYFLNENFLQYQDLIALDYQGNIGQYGNGEITLFFDPVNPKVQQLILNIYQELLDNYEIDGLHLDYIRYCIGNDNYLTSYGYNEESVAMFKNAYGYQDDIHLLVKNPKIFQDFCDFRRNELTKFVGKVRQLIDNYHQVKLSIAVVSDYQFASTSKLQDWVNWCKLKYIDEVYLMAYHLGSLPVYEDCIKAKNLLEKYPVFLYCGIAPIYVGCHINMVLEQIKAIKKANIDGISLFAFHSLLNRPDLYFYLNNNGPFKKQAITTSSTKDEVIKACYEEIKDKCLRIYLPNRLISENEFGMLLKQIEKIKNLQDVKEISYIANPKARMHIDNILDKLMRYFKNIK